MLVYERKVETDPSSHRSRELALPAPAGRLARKIADINYDYAVSCENYQLE